MESQINVQDMADAGGEGSDEDLQMTKQTDSFLCPITLQLLENPHKK